MRLVFACLCFGVSLCCRSVAGGRDRPLVPAYYYTLYGAEHGACRAFEHRGKDAPKLRFPPAIRGISSCAYPLIGPYDSMVPEIARRHMRPAKAAGSDGFLVDWRGPAGRQKPAGWTHDVFVKTVLPVAEEEQLPVVLSYECPQFLYSFDNVRDWTIRYLRQPRDSPAWLHIDGKSAWGVYRLWEGKLSPEEGREPVAAVEAQVGPVYWPVDRIPARQGDGGLEQCTPDERPEATAAEPALTWPDPYRHLRSLSAKPIGPPARLGAIARCAADGRRNGLRDVVCDVVTHGIRQAVAEWRTPELRARLGRQALRIVADLQGRAFEPPPLPCAVAVAPALRELLAARWAEGAAR